MRGRAAAHVLWASVSVCMCACDVQGLSHPPAYAPVERAWAWASLPFPTKRPAFGCRRAGAVSRWNMKGGGKGKGGQKGTAGSSSSSKAWLNEHVNDHWVKEAQRQGWRSRAAFKLLQLQEKDNLIRPGNLVIDLGSAPGSWTQVAAKIAGKDGVVVASDILEMKPVPGVNFICGDFTEDAVRGRIALALDSRRADVLLSDMAPNMSGNKLIDQGRHYNLVELAYTMAGDWLRTGGSAAFKVFRGEGFDECRATMSLLFREVHIRKPAASRGRSGEIFLVGLGFGLPSDVPDSSRADATLGGLYENKEGPKGAAKPVKKKDKAILDDMYDDDDGPAYAW